MALTVIREGFLSLEAIEAERCRRSFAHFVRHAWAIADPGSSLLWSTPLDGICACLQAVTEGRLRDLVINVPPGHSKSLSVSVLWPAWVWTRDPNWQAIFSSYEMEKLVMRDAVRTKDLTNSPWYVSRFRVPEYPCGTKNPHAWEYSAQQDTKAFSRNSRGGSRIGTSVGTGTGLRGSCFVGSTLVETEVGSITIKDLHEMSIRPRVWTLGARGLELKAVQASRVISGSTVGTVTTQTGSVLTCTNEHRIATGLRFVEAKDIRQGDEIYSLGERHLSDLQKRIQDPAVRVSQANCPSEKAGDARTTTDSSVLQSQVRCSTVRSFVEQNPKVLQKLWPEKGEIRAVLLSSLQRDCEETPALPTDCMPSVQHGLSTKRGSCSVLLSAVCESETLKSDAGIRQLTLQEWQQLCAAIQIDGASDSSPREFSVLGLQSTRSHGVEREAYGVDGAIKHENSSYRSRPQEQQARKPDLSLSNMSRQTPQVEANTVAESWKRCDGTHDVYDLQIEGNHNFFAEKILVHNCLVVDDPLRAHDADSEIAREGSSRWFWQTMSTRFNDPRAAVRVVIMQRLHEADLAGECIERGFQCLNLPSYFDPARRSTVYAIDGSVIWADPRTDPGQLLFPELFDAPTLAKLKVDLGSIAFSAQHQQDPAPEEGGKIKRDWFAPRWHTPQQQAIASIDGHRVRPTLKPDRFSLLSIMVDCAFRKTETSDYVAAGVFGLSGPRLYLLDLVWARMTFVETLQALRALHAKWQPHEICVEARANGDAVINVLSAEIPGFVAIEPDGGKESRIFAAAPKIEAGNLYLPLYPDFSAAPDGTRCDIEDLILQAIKFPKAAHDDAIDVIGYAINRLLTGSPDLRLLESLAAQ